MICIITICKLPTLRFKQLQYRIYFGNGASRNLAHHYWIRSIRCKSIFPTYGSEFSISANYSLFSLNGIDYATLGDKEEYKLKTQSIEQTNWTQMGIQLQ
jgi:hypothetical protein